MMNTRVALFLTYLALFFFCSAHAATITFKNKCPYTVWPGTLGADQKAQLSTTGFTLAGGATKTVKVPSPWLGLFWARTGCSSESGKFMCETADCGSGQVECNGAGAVPPATLIELRVAANKGKDYYVVSNVEGFNVPVSIAPHGGTGHCKASSCPANINSACPAKLQVKGSGGMVIACKSACLAFNQPKYCCTEDYSRAGKCRATNYSKFFEKQCPDAYNYANDKNSIFTCSGGPNYTITFCPAA